MNKSQTFPLELDSGAPQPSSFDRGKVVNNEESVTFLGPRHNRHDPTKPGLTTERVLE